MIVQELINDKNFMKSFITTAEQCYEDCGDFKDMFDIYEDELSEDQIGDLLEYCDKNDLISY